MKEFVKESLVWIGSIAIYGLFFAWILIPANILDKIASLSVRRKKLVRRNM